MTMIAFDRYNVIVKGIAAKPMSINGALLRILGIWLFSLAWTLAPFFGWNRFAHPINWKNYYKYFGFIKCLDHLKLYLIVLSRYVPEGNMTACGTDYLSKEWLSRSYILIYSVFVYFLPLLLIIYSYFFIVQVTDSPFILLLICVSFYLFFYGYRP